MLRSHTELFARRAREFADSVSGLGQIHAVGPQLTELLAEIRRKSRLCAAAERDLERYLEFELKRGAETENKVSDAASGPLKS
jgi:hypothetical protein